MGHITTKSALLPLRFNVWLTEHFGWWILTVVHFSCMDPVQCSSSSARRAWTRALESTRTRCVRLVLSSRMRTAGSRLSSVAEWRGSTAVRVFTGYCSTTVTRLTARPVSTDRQLYVFQLLCNMSRVFAAVIMQPLYRTLCFLSRSPS